MANVRVYKEYVNKEYVNKELAKIPNRVLSLDLRTHTHAHTCAHMRTHTRAHTRTHARVHTYTCVTSGDLMCRHVAPPFLSTPRLLPYQHAIKNIFLLNLIQNKLNKIHKKFRKITEKILEKSLKIKKFIYFKIQLQINLNLFHWIKNSIIILKKSKLINK